jgi:hypothetical protein
MWDLAYYNSDVDREMAVMGHGSGRESRYMEEGSTPGHGLVQLKVTGCQVT